MRFMDIILTEEQFRQIYDALELANSGYGDGDIAHLVALELTAWKTIQEVARTAGLDA
jgi:hypothetical protein